MTNELQRQAQQRLREWQACPPKFVRDVFGVTPDAWQDEALEAVAKHNLLAIRSNKGPGKTAWEAWVGWWFEFCFVESQIACVAITRENLRDNLWKELAFWYQKSPMLQAAFEWQKERIVNRKKPATWWISARAFPKDANPEQQANTLAGLHAKNVAVIIDEAGGVPQGVADAAEGVLANAEVMQGKAFVIMAGNPTHISGPLYRAFEIEPEHWFRMHITADPEFKKLLKYKNPRSITRFSNRVTQKWAKNLIKRHGRRSAVVMVNVLGEFPLGASDCIITLADFQDAMVRFDQPSKIAKKVLGADIGRQGSDPTAIAKRHGNALVGFEHWQGERVPDTARRIRDLFYDGKYDEVRIDDIGVGGGVTDLLMEWKIKVTPIDVGSTEFMSDEDKRKHVNLRSILFHDLQDVFLDQDIGINPEVGEDDAVTLFEEGNTLRIEFQDQTNKRKIESKQKYKKRVGHSPNFLDAVMLAWADRVSGPAMGATAVAVSNLSTGSHLLTPQRSHVRLLDRRGRRHANLRH